MTTQSLNDRFEILLLKCLFFNEELSRKVVVFIKEEYFEDIAEKRIFKEYKDFFIKFNRVANKEALLVSIVNSSDLRENDLKNIKETLLKITSDISDIDVDYIIKETEKWCQDRALYNAILESAVILQDKEGKKPRGAISNLVSDALSVSFDNSIGHNYIENAKERFDFYHNVDEKFPFDLKMLDKITRNGCSRKTLNILLAQPHAGKSLFMCHFAASYLLRGRNVLYITLELAAEKVAQRIDANLFDVRIDQTEEIAKDVYMSKIDSIAHKTKGKLIIKEYPTSSANVNHFKALLQDLKNKLKFVPEVIFIDYMNIMQSSTVSDRGNTYVLVKAISEEIRAFASTSNAVVWTATQTNRDGDESSDVGMKNVSESYGVNGTADLLLALMPLEHFKKKKQCLVKQLKNRYHDVSYHTKFLMGVDYSKMKLHDLEDSAQESFLSEEDKKNQPAKPTIPSAFIAASDTKIRDKAKKLKFD